MKKIISQAKLVFPYTIPVLTGYIVLGAAYGILMDSKGFSIWYVLLSSIFIYAGSMQFLSVSLLLSGFHPFYAFFITLMVNARHLFYGISMLSKLRGTGKLKPYLIFGLTDETFSLLCSLNPPKGISKKIFMLYITLLNQIYWILGSLLGSVLNAILEFDTKGIDFVLTALFVVILIDKWRESKKHLPFIIGIGSSIICRILFGSSSFILPTMILIVLLVSILQNKLREESTNVQ